MNDYLTPREQQILDLRRRGYTLEEIGRMFAVRRQRIHSIVQKAIKKLEEQSIDNAGH